MAKKLSLNENVVCKEYEEVSGVRCECYDCRNLEEVKNELLGKRCVKCGGRLIPI